MAQSAATQVLSWRPATAQVWFQSIRPWPLVRPWIVPLLLITPAFIPYVDHLLYAAETRQLPTGFLQTDGPYYMANAREYLEEPRGPFYGLPFSPNYDTPRIFFQPQTLFLALLWRITGWQPGVVFIVFGFVAALCCARIALALYTQVVGLDTRKQRIGLVLFFWGGGVLWLAGLGAALAAGGPGRLDWERLVDFDSGWGFWFLNFGRNLIYPMEAYYHAVFLGALLAVLKERYRLGLGLAAILSVSHPFSGAQLILVLLGWAALERGFLRTRHLPVSFLAATFGLLVFHMAFYIVWMGQSSEYRSVQQQWRLPWLYQAENFIPADALVGALALWPMRTLERARAFLASSTRRLLLSLFVMSFLLANHEFALQPVQPVHFTRGYEWIALFLLGVPVLMAVLGRLAALSKPWLVGVTLSALVAVGLADNALWLWSYYERGSAIWYGVYTTRPEMDLYAFLNRPEFRGSVVLPRFEAPFRNQLGYLTTLYTPLRAWWSHGHNTPDSDRRRVELEELFSDGKWQPLWDRRPVLVVTYTSDGERPGWMKDRELRRVFVNDRYAVFSNR